LSAFKVLTLLTDAGSTSTMGNHGPSASAAASIMYLVHANANVCKRMQLQHGYFISHQTHEQRKLFPPKFAVIDDAGSDLAEDVSVNRQRGGGNSAHAGTLHQFREVEI
jgi:hypothetical protein